MARMWATVVSIFCLLSPRPPQGLCRLHPRWRRWHRWCPDLAEDLSARADDRSDGFSTPEETIRGVVLVVLARLVHRLHHLTEDAGSALLGLEQACLLLKGQAFDLDVHLAGGDALGGAGHLEVHVAEVVLVTEDVAQDSVLADSLSVMRPMAMPLTGRLIGTPPSIRARVPAHTVAMSWIRWTRIRSQTNGVRTIVHRRQHRLQGAKCEVSVADFPAARAADRTASPVENGGKL